MILLFVILSTLPITHGESCSWQTTQVSGEFIKIIQLKQEGISITWGFNKTTNNITLKHTDDVSTTHEYDNDKIKINAASSKCCGDTNIKTNIALTVLLLLVATYHFSGIRSLTFVLLLMVVCTSITLSVSLDDCSTPRLHLIVPFRYAEKICLNHEKCEPIKCRLAREGSYSEVPANNPLLFSDKYCKIKKPDNWEEWVIHHFKQNITSEDLYFIDADGDGLSNILEYYSEVDFFQQDIENNTERERRSINNVNFGSDPLNPDSDGDLLLDGFEFTNGLATRIPDDNTVDDDNDGLDNLQEQIRKTAPKNADSDGDGIDDGDEVSQGTDPNDPSDNSKEGNNQTVALIKLTIGDHSGSHSERYLLKVGTVEHQSPDFGEIGSGIYIFKPGKYEITIQHVATNRGTPDYDYTAYVEKVDGDASVSIDDPSGLFGVHSESTYDFTSGKTAILTVECPLFSSNCGCRTTCEDCDKIIPSFLFDCSWGQNGKCNEANKMIPTESCSCKKCEEWYQNELKDTSWLKELNKDRLCPCTVRFTLTDTIATDGDPDEWSQDMSCGLGWGQVAGIPVFGYRFAGCKRYHPGANSCIRSEININGEPRKQQCCYYENGNIIPAGDPGAGTPDKSADYFAHNEDDVKPYAWCCEQCKNKKFCDYYIKGVRMGDTSHCLG